MGTRDSWKATASLTDSALQAAAGPGSPRLILALEGERPLAPPLCCALAEVDEVVLGRGRVRRWERARVGGARRLSIEVPDRALSTEHARLVHVRDRWVLEDTGSKNGTLVNGISKVRAVLADGDVVELGRTFFVHRAAGPPAGAGLGEAPGPAPDEEAAPDVMGLQTLVPQLAASLRALARVAPSEVSVVLLGESGTGKEVVARALHAASGRRGRLVAVNCGALPANLVEASLFGHRRGAFSGAVDDRPGLVRSADGGTLFLDEVGELPPAAQVALLRVLQEREVVPVGDSRPVPADVRLVAATHRDLDALEAAGAIRGDFKARLTGLSLTLPPLRERREDLGIIVGALLRRLSPLPEKITLSGAAARALFLHGWPLNVRELEKSLGAALVLAGGANVSLEHLPAPVRASLAPPELPARAGPLPTPSAPPPPITPPPDAPLRDSLETIEREQILVALDRCAGNQTRAAALLGISRRTLVDRLGLYGIRRPRKE